MEGLNRLPPSLPLSLPPSSLPPTLPPDLELALASEHGLRDSARRESDGDEGVDQVGGLAAAAEGRREEGEREGGREGGG
jgi:hypothetical protein